jgi:outer membrane protein
MTILRLTTCTVLAGAVIAVSSGALAQARSAAPRAAAPAAAPAAVAQGPAISGLCILGVQQAIAGSTVGKYVNDRMGQIVSQVKAELQPEDTQIATDGRALEAKRSSLDAATFQSQAQALQTRANALREKADLRQREVQATEQKALNRIAQELDPIAKDLYQQHHCSILVNREAVMIANPEMDLTTAAVTALNARIQQFAFDREHLDTAQPATR